MIAQSFETRYNALMKKILVGFLTYSCLSLFVTARVPLHHKIYTDKSSPAYSVQKQVNGTHFKNFLPKKISAKRNHSKRLFRFDKNSFIPDATKVIYAWKFIGFLVCFSALFFSAYLFSVSPRSPPAKLCF